MLAVPPVLPACRAGAFRRLKNTVIIKLNTHIIVLTAPYYAVYNFLVLLDPDTFDPPAAIISHAPLINLRRRTVVHNQGVRYLKHWQNPSF